MDSSGIVVLTKLLANGPIFGWVIKASLSCRGIFLTERAPGCVCFEIETRPLTVYFRHGWKILLNLLLFINSIVRRSSLRKENRRLGKKSKGKI